MVPASPGEAVDGDDPVFRRIFEAIPNPLFLMDEHMRILNCNSAAEEILSSNREWTFQLVQGRDMSCIHGTSDPTGCGGRGSCGECVIRRSVGAAVLGQKVIRERARIERVDRAGAAGTRLLQVTATPFPGPGIARAVLMLEDVTEFETLKGLIPICAGCKKIRDDSNYWQEVETFMQERSPVEFTHGLCPDCIKRYYPEMADRILRE